MPCHARVGCCLKHLLPSDYQKANRVSEFTCCWLYRLEAVDIAGKFDDPKAAAREITGHVGNVDSCSVFL